MLLIHTNRFLLDEPNLAKKNCSSERALNDTFSKVNTLKIHKGYKAKSVHTYLYNYDINIYNFNYFITTYVHIQYCVRTIVFI